MRCWTVRRRLADVLEGTLNRAALDAVERHLLSCASCRQACDASARVSQQVADAGRIDARSRTSSGEAGDLFEANLMREIRARVASRATAPEASLAWRPAPLAAAVVLMVAAGIAALYLGGYVTGVSPDGFTPRLQASRVPAQSAVEPDAVAQATDDLSPEEIPFLVHRDLVGPQRGRIPMTTYVMEPAPIGSDVRRASF